MELYHNDCIPILIEMVNNGRKVDSIFTSPPYNRKRNDKYTNYQDTKPNYYEFLKECIDLSLKVVRKNIFFNIQAQYYNKKDVYKLIGEYADKISQLIVWEKSNPLPANGFNITNAYEFIIVFGKIKSNKTYTKNHITTSINTRTSKIHRAIMKQEVADWVIENFTKENDTVMDIFMGTGTTGVSCKKFNREFIGIEIDKQYFELAKERIENT